MGGCAEKSEIAEESLLERTKRLANDGDALAQSNLGSTYLKGKDVPKDYEEAVKWYRKSAEQGYASAQYNLGNGYNFGEGVPQDYKEAYAWLSVAKANGLELAEKNLGIVTKKMTKEQIVQAKSISIEISKRIEANRKSENDDLRRKLNEFLRQDINKEIDIEAEIEFMKSLSED